MLVFKILLGLTGLTLVVLAHEIGHFIFARLCGIEVITFSIGMGRKLFSFKWKGTEFRVSLLPLGGYCRMKGEQNLIQAWEQQLAEIPKEKGAFYSAHPLKRILVALGGPVFNLVFAALVYAVLNMVSFNIPYQEPRILLASEILNNGSEGDRDYPADNAGFRSGDMVTAIEGKPVSRFAELEEMVATSAEKPLTFTVLRGSDTLTLTVTPELDKEDGSGRIGVFPLIPPVIGKVEVSSPAELAGLRQGDLILAIQGQPVTSTIDVMRKMSGSVHDYTLTWNRGGITQSGRLFYDGGAEPGFRWQSMVMKSPRLNPVAAIGQGVTQTGNTLLQIIRGFKTLTRGIKLQNAVSGPIRITWYTGEIASTMFSDGPSAGLAAWFQFMALISIALGFMNLLPVPVLDGGQILLFVIEMIKRSPLHPKMIYRYQLVGTAVLAVLVVLALASDFLFFAGR
jgi:regulator of sigma E protease